MRSKAFAVTAVLLGLAVGACSSKHSEKPIGANGPPIISAVTLSAARIEQRKSVELTVGASDPDDDALTYTFSRGTCDGNVSGGVEGTPQAANIVTFDAGNTVGSCQLRVTVADSHGLTAEGTATLDVEPPRFVVTPTSPAALDNVVGIRDDGAPGFDGGSITATGTRKAELYFTPSKLFGHAVTVGDVARMSYWTKKGTTHVDDVHDWFLAIYTTPYAGQTTGWYGARIGAEPYLAAHLDETAGGWNRWSTDGATNQLRFFESTYGYFGSYTDPSWNDFVAASSLTGSHASSPVPYAAQEILYFTVQTASSAAGFDGQLDGVRIELKDGSIVEIDMQPDPANQGFESDTGGWIAAKTITRVVSGGGTLHLPASAGSQYAEVQNLPDGYQAGYGDAGYSYFGGKGAAYEGDFYQAIDVYVDAAWAPGANPAVDGFWIDMAPNHADPANYGAEHNFHLLATGGQVDVRVDGEAAPIASITSSGWYTFLMTFEKGATADTPVVTDMVVLDAQKTIVGQATVAATSPGGPFLSKDLLGNGYVWITVWQNGFAGDVLAIDNLQTALLPYR